MIKPLVSIIIVSYNTKELLLNCLASIKEYKDVSLEIIISDNGSTDGTLEVLRKYKDLPITLIENQENLGFSKGNNVGRKYAKGEYVLFLNPDTLLQRHVLSETLSYMQNRPDVGALTCKVVLPDGSLDPDTRRSFPTPLVAITHFSGLDRLFPKSPIVGRYWYGYKDEDEISEIDCLQGAYFLTRKKVLNKVSWFDEDYFLDGEDIDLCWKIREQDLKIIYYPQIAITHIKKGSKKKNKSRRSVTGGVQAMEIFYRKRMWTKYPLLVNYMVIAGIKVLLLIRTAKFYLS